MNSSAVLIIDGCAVAGIRGVGFLPSSLCEPTWEGLLCPFGENLIGPIVPVLTHNTQVQTKDRAVLGVIIMFS